MNEWSPTWEQFIPDPQQFKHFADFGYYSLPLTDAHGKNLGDQLTKVFAVNTVACYQYNFYAMAQFEDPGNMLDWLEEGLSDLER